MINLADKKAYSSTRRESSLSYQRESRKPACVCLWFETRAPVHFDPCGVLVELALSYDDRPTPP